MADAFDVQIDTSKIDARLGRLPLKVENALRGVIRPDMLSLAERVRAKLNGEVLQKRSGALQNSIKSQMVEVAGVSIYGRVFSDGSVKYAGIQERGGQTKPHDIVAKNGGTLAFMMGGKMRFFKRVHHPGSKIPARSYMASSMAEMRDKIIADMRNAVLQAARTE